MNKYAIMAKLMQDITQLAADNNINETIDLGEFRYIIEAPNQYRHGSLTILSKQSISSISKAMWSSISMYIRTSRNHNRMGTISDNMIFTNTIDSETERVILSSFDIYADDDAYLEVPMELDLEDEERDAFIFQNSLTEKYKEFEFMVLCYDIAKVLDRGEFVMYNHMIEATPEELDTIIHDFQTLKAKYESV